MKNLNALVFLLLHIVTALCSTISVTFRHAYPCSDANHRSHTQTVSNCDNDVNCVENAYCHNLETCMCKEGYMVNPNRTECLKIPERLNDACKEDIQCHMTFTTESECVSNECRCLKTAHYVQEYNRCYKSVGIGGSCQISRNCIVPNSICASGVCRCESKFHASEDGEKCLRSKYLGDECSIDYECIPEHSRCSNTCRCKVDYVLANDKQRCLKAANLIGDPCDEDVQCKDFVTHARCGDDNKCTCKPEFNQRGSACLRKINPAMMEKTCRHRSQCVLPLPDNDFMDTDIPNVDCRNGICTCASDYTLTPNKADCIRFSENKAERATSLRLLLILVIVRLLSSI